MDILDALSQRSRQTGLRFLVIGGHAVIAHGHPRFTKDLDLLVCKTDRDQWISLLGDLGFPLWRDGGIFLQFQPPSEDEWPIDLMLVSIETFNKLLAQSCEATISATPVHIPSLEHLLALKIHALKSMPEHRTMRDLDDVLRLIERHKIDVDKPEFRDLFIKHGNMELYERIARIFGKK